MNDEVFTDRNGKTYTKSELNKIADNYNKSHNRTRLCFVENGMNLIGEIEKPIFHGQELPWWIKPNYLL